MFERERTAASLSEFKNYLAINHYINMIPKTKVNKKPKMIVNDVYYFGLHAKGSRLLRLKKYQGYGQWNDRAAGSRAKNSWLEEHALPPPLQKPTASDRKTEPNTDRSWQLAFWWWFDACYYKIQLSWIFTSFRFLPIHSFAPSKMCWQNLWSAETLTKLKENGGWHRCKMFLLLFRFPRHKGSKMRV